MSPGVRPRIRPARRIPALVLARRHLISAGLVVLVAGLGLFLAGVSVGKDMFGSRPDSAGSSGLAALRKQMTGPARDVAESVEEPGADGVFVDLESDDDIEPTRQAVLHFDRSESIPKTPYGHLIYRTARRYSMSPRLVAAVVKAESGFDPMAVSPKGARGLMQVMPATGRRFGVNEDRLFEPATNLDVGVRYLSWLTEHFSGDVSRVLAAYNAGEGAVEEHGGIPPYRETRNFVRKVYSSFRLDRGDVGETYRGR